MYVGVPKERTLPEKCLLLELWISQEVAILLAPSPGLVLKWDTEIFKSDIVGRLVLTAYSLGDAGYKMTRCRI